VPKTYLVTVDRPVSGEDLEKLRRGVTYRGEHFRGAEVEKTAGGRVRLTIREGKKRQVKKMFASLGYGVTGLKRTQIGNYSLGRLKSGRHVILEEEDVEKLLET